MIKNYKLAFIGLLISYSTSNTMQKYLPNRTINKDTDIISYRHSVLLDCKYYNQKDSKFYKKPRYDSVEEAIKQFPPKTITNLTLQSLDLKELPSNFRSFVNLKLLNLISNNLEELSVDTYSDIFSKLKFLFVYNNPIDHENIKKIKGILSKDCEFCS